MQHWQEVNATLAGSKATLQTQLLHACLKKTCDVKVLTDVCGIIATVKGNPRMKSLGKHMKTEWEKGVCCHSVCACACVERVNVYMCVYLHVALHKVWLSPAKCSGGCQSLGDTMCAVCV